MVERMSCFVIPTFCACFPRIASMICCGYGNVMMFLVFVLGVLLRLWKYCHILLIILLRCLALLTYNLFYDSIVCLPIVVLMSHAFYIALCLIILIIYINNIFCPVLLVTFVCLCMYIVQRPRKKYLDGALYKKCVIINQCCC